MDVTGFTLYNSETNQALQSVNEGETLDFRALQEQYGTTEFTIVCETTGLVESTLMTDSTGRSEIDNDAPYALTPGTGSDVGTTPFLDDIGPWTVTCQPFCLDGGPDSTDPDQIAGTEETINFVVAFATEEPTSAPTIAPTSGE